MVINQAGSPAADQLLKQRSVIFVSSVSGGLQRQGGGSAAADIGHSGRMGGHELHVGFQWKHDSWIVGKTAL